MYKQSTWRLLVTPPANGAWNMAVDEAILESVINGKSPATLRLFAWNPPCLSLGQAQSIQDIDFIALKQYGWTLVRRPTGGRAILHADELTYSIIAHQNEPVMAGNVLESYRRLSQALLAVLQLIGVNAQADKEYTPSTKEAEPGPVCFEVPSNYEITVAGKKIIGSAQARRQQGVLQHGSIPLTGDLTRICDALVYPDKLTRQRAKDRLLARAATLETITGQSYTFEALLPLFKTAFLKLFRIELETGNLTSSEEALTDQLVHSKYNHPNWTNRIP